MIIKEHIRYKNRLDSLFENVSQFSGDSELQAHWAKYLCILVSGYIEVSIKDIYWDYAVRQSSQPIANYVSKQLSGLKNLNMEKIIQLSGTFKKEWAECLKKETDGRLKDAIDSIYTNRNQIAHGKDVGLTYIRIQDLYSQALKVIELINDQCE